MLRPITGPYQNIVAVLTTMHAKERVIGPILRDELGGVDKVPNPQSD